MIAECAARRTLSPSATSSPARINVRVDATSPSGEPDKLRMEFADPDQGLRP